MRSRTGRSVPGAFVGAVAFRGNATVFWATLVSLIVGALLAYASELLADVIERSVGGRVRTSEPSAVTA